MSAAEMTQASRVVALESDAAKIDGLIAAVRAVSFSSLCPAGRAAVGDALESLWRAEAFAAEQIKALASSAPTLRVLARIRDRGDFANVSRQGTVLGIDDGWLVIQWDEIERTERCPAGLVGGRFSVIG